MSNLPGKIELLQQLMNNMTDNIFFKDRNSRFVLMNEACARWNGFSSPQEAIGKSDYDLFTPDFADAAHADEQKIMETGQPLLCKEECAEWEDGHAKWVSTTKIPLRDEDGQTVGCIGIGRDITELKQKEVELEQANEKLRLASEQIAQDLHMAAKLQQTFLPQSYPVFSDADGNPLMEFHHLYDADQEIGGDYCFVHKISDMSAGLLICDVMGHGVRSALVTGIIRAITDELIHHAMCPGDFLTAMNRHLFPLLHSGDAFLFTTACYLVIDAKTGALTGALAGHPVPYLVRPKPGCASLLDIDPALQGPALAIVEDYDYPTFSAALSPGDKILLYTDGICETEDHSTGEEFGERLFQQTLQDGSRVSLKQLLPLVMKAAQDFTHNQKLGDDVCLLGVSLNALTDG